MYNRITAQDVEALKRLTDSSRVFTGEEISEDYSHDELGGTPHYPEVLINAMSTEEVAAVMKYANEHRIPVVARGSGTGLVGASIPVCGGIMLCLTGMNRILELDTENLTVTIQPGVLLMELSAYCEERGYFYPPDPGEKSATVGGNISTNAGGMRAVKYGTTRDYVRALTVVLPDGSVERFGAKVAKNSSGYDLKDLIIGSEGTLGIITEAVMRILPLPKVSVSLLVPFPSFRDAIKTVPVLAASGIPLTAIEFMEREIILFTEEYLGKRFPDTKAPAYLLLTLDGSDRAVVDKQTGEACELCIENGALDAYLVDTDERKTSVWSARSAFLEAIKAGTTEIDECDVVVPRNSVADFIIYTHELEDETGVHIPSFGHAGDGNLHIYLCRGDLGDKAWAKAKEDIFALLYARAVELGGLVSGEHGIGLDKKKYLRESAGERQIALMKGIKAVFDPNGILNPQKVID